MAGRSGNILMENNMLIDLGAIRAGLAGGSGTCGLRFGFPDVRQR
jgi:hypothetical protein